jgi:predicted MFS family arabinose efflux permease
MMGAVPRLRYQLVLFTLIRTVINTMYRMVYPFLPAFVRGIGVDLQAISLALGGRSVVGAVGPFLAAIADARGRKAGMLAGLGLFFLGVSLVVIWPTFWAFMGALVLTGLGKAVFDPAVYAYLGDRVPYKRRGTAIGLLEFGWSFSFIVGVPLMGMLISSQGWMAPFPLLAVLGLVSLVLVARFVQDDRPDTPAKVTIWLNLTAVFRHRSAVAGLAVGLLSSAANEMINLVFGVWLEEILGLQIAALGAASLVIGLSELGGETLVSGLTDRLGKKRAIAVGLALNSLAALALPLLGQSVPGAFTGLFLFYITFEFTLVSIIPMMTEVLPEARATLVGANSAGLSMGRALGAFAAPLIYSGSLLPNAVAVVLLNLLALVALRRVAGEPAPDALQP